MKPGRPSRTAQWVAFARAYATLDPPEDRICDDPIAAAYLSAPERALLLASRLPPVRAAAARESTRSPFTGSWLYPAVRTAFIDRALLRRVGEGLDQLVLLGAGFDSRAERFAGDLAGVRIFELDFPATQARKLAVRPAAPNVTYLPMDLAREPFADRLLAAGFDPAKRTVFLWEGVVYFLTREQVGAVLDGLRRLLSPGGTVLLDYGLAAPRMGVVDQALLAVSLAVTRLLGEPVQTRFAQDEVAPLFGGHGFTIADRAEVGELWRRHLRGRYAGTKLIPFWGCLELTAR